MQLDSEDCLRQVMAIRGVLGATLVDYPSGLAINSVGREPGGDGGVTAAGVTSVVNAAIGGAPFASIGIAESLDDIVVTAGNGYHLVYFLGARPDSLLVLYVWLDRLRGNLAMARLQLRRVEEDLQV